MLSFNISGTLSLNSNGNGTSFKFLYPVSIIVQPNGTIQDLTTGKTIFIPQSTIIVGLSGSNAANGSTIVQIPPSRRKRAVGDRVIVTSTAAGSTIAITQTIIKSYDRVTAVCQQSGSVTDPNSFLGRFILTNAICTAGCGIDIPSGINTLALGATTLQISKLEVSQNSTASFGTPGVTTYTFATIIDIEVRGTLQYLGAGAIAIPAGSDFNLYSTATFVASQVTQIQIISTTGTIIRTPILIAANYQGPFFLETYIDGSYSFSNKSMKDIENFPIDFYSTLTHF